MPSYALECRHIYEPVKGTGEQSRVAGVLLQIWQNRVSLSHSQVFDPRAELAALSSYLKDNSTDNPVEKLSIAADCIDSVAAGLPIRRPERVSRFYEGWMEGTDDKKNKAKRRMVYKALIHTVHDHLTGGFSAQDRPIRCTGDCRCVWQRSPISNRGGSARRVPCARTELLEAPIYSIQRIQHVSS